MSDRDPSKDSRYDPRWVAARYRPKPTSRDLYPTTKRREAAERRDAERADIEPISQGAVQAFLARVQQVEQEREARANGLPPT